MAALDIARSEYWHLHLIKVTRREANHKVRQQLYKHIVTVKSEQTPQFTDRAKSEYLINNIDRPKSPYQAAKRVCLTTAEIIIAIPRRRARRAAGEGQSETPEETLQI